MRTRDYRRAQLDKRKGIERRKHPCCPTPRQVGIYANTRTRCSCPTCRAHEDTSTRKARGLRR